MTIWAIADLHLSFGVPNKKMDVFGPAWLNHENRLKEHWIKLIGDDDLILLAGDISWGKRLDEALEDLRWIDELPGTKVMIRGNHDYWWSSKSKIRSVLPKSLNIIHNDSFEWKGVSIGGARLWDSSEYHFHQFIDFIETPEISKAPKEQATDDEKIFERELLRLEMSLKGLNSNAKQRICMTHYPPIAASLEASRASAILEQYDVGICVFGHLHSVFPNKLPFGIHNGIRYVLTSCDYLDCRPIKICD